MTPFGRYTLLRRVGVGGMAEVWKARIVGPEGFEKTLAIKKVLPELAEQRSFVEMFVEEAKIAADLVHPNIAQLFEFGRVGERDYFIAMEYVPGANLERLIGRLTEAGAWLPPQAALFVAMEACRGLSYAHTRTDAAGFPRSIVHRDVSPQNILVSFGGDVKLVDFGIAKIAGTIQKTAIGELRGKIAYMAPEQAAGDSTALDQRTDVFQLGLVLYELIARHRLFPGTTAMAILSGLAGYRGMTDQQLEPIPQAFRSILVTALQPAKDLRFRSAAAMENAIQQVVGGDALLDGRKALAGIVQHLFEDERRAEVSMPGFAEAAAAVGGGGAVTAAASGETGEPKVKVPPSGITKIPSGITKSPSGVTLAPTPINVTTRRKTGTVISPMIHQRTLPWRPVLAIAVAGGLAFGAWKALPLIKPPAPVATPTPEATATPNPTKTPRKVSSAKKGFVFVRSDPEAEVLIDDKVIGKTPLASHGLDPGFYRLRLKRDDAGFDLEQFIEIRSGATLVVVGDPKAKTITVSP